MIGLHVEDRGAVATGIVFDSDEVVETVVVVLHFDLGGMAVGVEFVWVVFL